VIYLTLKQVVRCMQGCSAAGTRGSDVFTPLSHLL